MSAASTARRVSRIAAYSAAMLLLAVIITIAAPLASGRVSASIPPSGGFQEQTGGGTVYLNGTIHVANGGLYPIDRLTFDSAVVSPAGSRIYNSSGTLPSIPAGIAENLYLSVSIPVSALRALFSNVSLQGALNVTVVTTLHGSYGLGTVRFTISDASPVQLTAPATKAAASPGGERAV